MPPQNNNKELERLLTYKSDPDLAILDELDQLTQVVSDLNEKLTGIPVRDIQALPGKDGYTPQRGVDYGTEDEMREMHEEIQANVLANMKGELELAKDDMRLELSPIKGIDYVDGIDGRDGIDGITPVKGADYFTDEDINEIVLSSVEYLESLSGEARLDASAIKNIEKNIDPSKLDYGFLTIDYKQIRNVPKQTDNGTGGGGGNRTLKWLNDITNANTATTGQILSKRADGRFEFITASGTGDMLVATYDPTGVSADAFDVDNHTDGTTNKVYTATEKTKLAGIEASATADMTGAEIKAAYEAEADTNAYTDAEKTKLTGIEAGATANTGALADLDTVDTAQIADDAVTIGKIADAAIVTEAEGISANDNDTTLPTSAAVKAYADSVAGGGVSDGDKGDITVSASGATWTIDNDVVTYAKMQNVSATDRLLGRDTAGAGDVEELTPAAVRTMLNVEDGADVTDTTNVTAAGALMDSEVTDLDGIKSLTVPNNTTISAFGATLVDDADAATARATLDVDQAGTDNSTDVTLAGTPDYITISGQVITRNAIDLTSDVTGVLPEANLPDASATAQGVVELATPAECTTGTDTSRAVTPEGLKTVADTKVDVAGETMTGALVAADHGTATNDEVVNVCYGTSATPPTASTTTEGTLYIQYTA